MDKVKSIYIDCDPDDPPIQPDDFVVAIGALKSNSVYHVVESRPKAIPEKRLIRYHIKVFDSDLVTALFRDSCQQIITLYWYPRTKKS